MAYRSSYTRVDRKLDRALSEVVRVSEVEPSVIVGVLAKRHQLSHNYSVSSLYFLYSSMPSVINVFAFIASLRADIQLFGFESKGSP